MNKYAKAISKYTNHFERIKIVDFLRGFCALLMIFDHTMYDLMMVTAPMWGYNKTSMQLASFATYYWKSDLRAVGWVCAVSCFFFFCGMSTGLSRNNLLRGFRLAVVASLVTVVTRAMEIIISMRGVTINFGVLHALSFCILAYALCIEGGKKVKLFKTRNHVFNLADVLTLLMFGVTSYVIISNSISPSNHPTNLKFSALSQMSANDYLTYALGISKTLPSSDYIPVLPWFAVFLTGAFFSGFIKRKPKTVFKKEKTDFVSFVGKNTLLLYVAHQPVIYAILYIVGVILTGKIILYF